MSSKPSGLAGTATGPAATRSKAATAKPSAKARRSAARLAAVQAIYQMGITGIDADAVIGEFVRFRFGEPVEGAAMVVPDALLFGDIVRGATDRREDIDGLIEGALDQPWSLPRLDALLRATLRAGAWELLGSEATPPQIIVSDYVNVAHAFFSGREPGMVNAVLDRIARRLRPEAVAATTD